MTTDQQDGYAELRQWFDTTGHSHLAVLRWLGRWKVGYAHYGHTSRSLKVPPAIEGDDIEYLGGSVGRIDGQPMTPEQLLATHMLLIKMDTDAGDAICGHSTTVVVYDRKPTHE